MFPDELAAKALPRPGYEAIVRHAAAPLIAYTADGTICFANPATEQLLGYRVEDWIGRSLFEIAAAGERDRARDLADRLRGELGATGADEFTVVDRDGRRRTLEVRVVNRLDDPAIGLYIGTLRDVTERNEMDARLRQTEGAFHAAFNAAPVGMAIVATRHGILRVNRSLCDTFRMEEDELVGLPPYDLIEPDDHEAVATAVAELRDGAAQWTGTLRLRRGDDSAMTARTTLSAVRDEHGQLAFLLVYVEDVTERETFVERLARQASTDALTGLANRTAVIAALEHHHDIGAGAGVAVLMCDLDDFKLVNATLGTDAGDEVLVEFGERLRNVVRDGDLVARIGGDRFCVVLPAIGSLDAARGIADRIVRAGNGVFISDAEGMRLSTSVGIALGNAASAERDTAELLDHATAALVEAKAHGRGRIEVFDAHALHVRMERVGLLRDLARAIDEEELRLYYQPVVSLDGTVLEGFEALVRWAHPERGLVPPIEFITLAEEADLIGDLGRWVLFEACRQLRDWRAAGLAPKGCTVSVNLSARQLAEPSLTALVADALSSAGLRADDLRLEVTESMLVDDHQRAARTLQQLRALGVGLSIDDFGTGYSSLNHLRQFPFDCLKIDRSFVDGLGQDDDAEAIVAAVTGMARALRLGVVAEGVETTDQRDALARHGIERAQGYLYAAPLPAAAVEEWLRPRSVA